MLKRQAFFTPRVRVAELLTEVLRQLALLGQRSCPVQRLLIRLQDTERASERDSRTQENDTRHTRTER